MLVKVNKESTLKELLRQEDTDNDKKITVDDQGPKEFNLQTVDTKIYKIKGTYQLSNLLQELALKKIDEEGVVEILLQDINQNPTDRISKMIREYYWDRLTRTLDKNSLVQMVSDEKLETKQHRLYVPYNDKIALAYYQEIVKDIDSVKIEILPKKITPKYVRSINDRPGILGLAVDKTNEKPKAVPYLVPGGRFNEMYGWDSYFINIGLLLDQKTELAKGMIDNFTYQIKNYGKILNANRSYYLTRTQPPFYTSMVIEAFKHSKENMPLNWLKTCLETAIYEYEKVWMQEGKRLAPNGLNRYFGEGMGITPEVEEGHYDYILKKYTKGAITLKEYQKKYLSGEIENSELDEYFTHDRSVRESGHDTSYRIEGVSAHLTPVDLNSLLYKYEKDLGYIIQNFFDDEFEYENRKYSSDYWNTKAGHRKKKMDDYMWGEKSGSYFDYNFKEEKQTDFESATAFYPLWAKACIQSQADSLVKNILPKLKSKGGISGCSMAALKNVPVSAPQRQWDYPYGWAPHQMLIWQGLINYNFIKEANELIYRWLWLITKNAVDFNGVIPEKYDVVKCTYKTNVEYGNVGSEFEYVPDGGFGWMNASYQLGLSLLRSDYRNKLDELIDPDEIFGKV